LRRSFRSYTRILATEPSAESARIIVAQSNTRCVNKVAGRGKEGKGKEKKRGGVGGRGKKEKKSRRRKKKRDSLRKRCFSARAPLDTIDYRDEHEEAKLRDYSRTPRHEDPTISPRSVLNIIGDPGRDGRGCWESRRSRDSLLRLRDGCRLGLKDPSVRILHKATAFLAENAQDGNPRRSTLNETSPVICACIKYVTLIYSHTTLIRCASSVH